MARRRANENPILGQPTDLVLILRDLATAVNSIAEAYIIPCSDQTTALTAGTEKFTIPDWPFPFRLTDVRAGLTVAQASGSIFTVDVNKDGASILSTKLTIDNTELTSRTAATRYVMSDTYLAEGSKVSFDIDQVGNGSAKGLVVTLYGYQ